MLTTALTLWAAWRVGGGGNRSWWWFEGGSRMRGYDTVLGGVAAYMVWPSLFNQAAMALALLEGWDDFVKGVQTGGKGGLYWGIGRWVGVSAETVSVVATGINVAIAVMALSAMVEGRKGKVMEKEGEEGDGKRFFKVVKRSILDEMENFGMGGGKGHKCYRRRREKGEVGLETAAYTLHVRNRISSKITSTGRSIDQETNRRYGQVDVSRDSTKWRKGWVGRLGGWKKGWPEGRIWRSYMHPSQHWEEYCVRWEGDIGVVKRDLRERDLKTRTEKYINTG
ncbi:hypothetical protein TrCOL_g7172 [Triparma columacea]|uniref:Uncharacterized protein n=1 Tax=Triparma columacea TaxID=722753 RepID=A0A9W7G9L0_9STRA|nr:hypothetical protein TrCOL_g7172 [Triparma columacea]